MKVDTTKNRELANSELGQLLFVIACVVMIGLGVYFCFAWRNWSEGSNLHPDEYGLTNTLTQLRIPGNLSEYFNTRISPISPYNHYDELGTLIGNGPDNRMRWGQWPIILIRSAGEITHQAGYDEIRLLGRTLSAIADCLTLVMLFLIGLRLFDWKVGLLAATFGSLTVLQIQQSHFMTVDTFTLLFTMFSIYAAISIAKNPTFIDAEPVSAAKQTVQTNPLIWKWFVLYGVGFGMAVASKINLILLGGLLPVALFVGIADVKLRSQRDLLMILRNSALLLVIGYFASFATFRVTQPMSFRAVSGETTLLTLHLNQDWVDSMEVAQMESSGVGGGPPAEQWTHRTMILFPLMNMVFWGMGLPLGLATWIGVFTALWLLLRKKQDWRVHLIPLGWTLAYFLFMGTRWVKSMRYFLPIYPLLCLYAAWGLLYLIRRMKTAQGEYKPVKKILAYSSFLVVFAGTLIWANAFTQAIYVNRHTRLLATEWIFEHIPGAVNFVIATDEGEVYAPLVAENQFELSLEKVFSQSTKSPVDGEIVGIYFPRIAQITDENRLALQVLFKAQDDEITTIPVPLHAGEEQTDIRIDLEEGVKVSKGQVLSLEVINQSDAALRLEKVTISNESWDEGLPVRFNGWDPFGQLYYGNTMEVRWMDDENKKQMFLETLQATDYLMVPSQRAVWASSRMPLMYPMTMTYYEALFSGNLGYDLIAEFQTPMKIGDLYISDVGGDWALGENPELPLFNFNALAAEEAFSVYDHPPVWIFKKRADFNLENARQILDSVDLSQVIVQSPREATFFITKQEK